MSLSTMVCIRSHKVYQAPYCCYACQSNYATQQTVLTLNSVFYSHAHINRPQVLKLYAWEEAFQRRLQVIRDQELHYVRKAAIYLSGTAISFSCSTVMVSATIPDSKAHGVNMGPTWGRQVKLSWVPGYIKWNNFPLIHLNFVMLKKLARSH